MLRKPYVKYFAKLGVIPRSSAIHPAFKLNNLTLISHP
jgi:hypothetical protein